MLIANVYGRLSADPVERQTKTGKAMTTANVAVDVAGKDAEAATLWVSILAFGHAAEDLLQAHKGESVAAIGKLTRGEYTAKTGETREQWTLLSDTVICAKSARPAGGQRKPESTARGFDDDIPFGPQR